MFNKDGILGKVGNIAKKATDLNQRVTQGVTDKILEKKAPTERQGIYETFIPSMGLGRTFIFTETSLIVSGTEYPYSELETINLVSPASSLTNGVAQTSCNGKRITLAFNEGQNDNFIKMMQYANERIDQAKGIVRDHKFLLNCGPEVRIEVYDDYLMFYQVKSGLRNVFSNSFAGGSGGEVMMFTDIDLKIQTDANGAACLLLTHEGDTQTLPLYPEDFEVAQNVIAFIDRARESLNNDEPAQTNEKWEPIVPETREFPLGGQNLVIDANLDAFNSYRSVFRDLARQYQTAGRQEYDKRVRDLTTYLKFFPDIYYKYLDALCAKAMDIFIAEGVWTVTKESFSAQHLQTYNEAVQAFEVTLESIKMTVENNVAGLAALTNLVPNLVGGGFGMKGAMKGIAKAEAFNFIRDGIEEGLLKSAAQINLEQQNELFGRVNADQLFLFVYNDYWRVFLSLATELNKNGRMIWFPTEDQATMAANIFSNMSNPNFPQDKKTEVFINILQTFPYNKAYLQYMVDTYGDNAETSAIRDYFGYSSFDDPLLGM